MSEISRALQEIKKGDGKDVQPLLHLIEVISASSSSSSSGSVVELLTLSPGLDELFTWWERGPGLHVQSGACFSVLVTLNTAVLRQFPDLHVQAVSLGRRLLKERLHSVYTCLSSYSSHSSKTNCLKFLTLLNCFGGSVTRTLVEDFNFGNAALKGLLAKSDPAHEDAVRFMLSFLCVSSVELKIRFMTMKNVLKIMTNHINKDSVQLKQELVSVLCDHVLGGSRIQKTILCQFFSVPALVKIAKFWEEPGSSDLQHQTYRFFTTLFSRTPGILFESSASDIFTGSSRNPLLLSFIKHVSSVNNSYFSEFLVAMSNLCPEISSSLISGTLPKNFTNPTFVTDLSKVFEGRDVVSLLDTVNCSVTDKQIIDFLVPRSVTELLEKQLKSTPHTVYPLEKQLKNAPHAVYPLEKQLKNTPHTVYPLEKQLKNTPHAVYPLEKEVNSTVYSLLLTLVQSAAIAVQRLPERDQLRDIALFNLVDISTIHAAGLLTPHLATLLLKIDQYCLYHYKVDKLLGYCCGVGLKDDGAEFLISLYPAAVKKFLLNHQAAVAEKVLEKTPLSRRLFRKILVSVTDSSLETLNVRKLLESVLFDDHSGLPLKIHGNNEEVDISEEFPVFINRLFDISTGFASHCIKNIANGVLETEAFRGTVSDCRMIIELLLFVQCPKNEQSDLGYKFEEKLTLNNCPVYYLGSNLLCQSKKEGILGDVWTNSYCGISEDMKTNPTVIKNLLLALKHSVQVESKTCDFPTYKCVDFIRVLSVGNIFMKMEAEPEGYLDCVVALREVVEMILNVGFKFTESITLLFVSMKDLLGDSIVDRIVKSYVSDPFETDCNGINDFSFLENSNILNKFVEFFRDRNYQSFACPTVNLFRLFQSNNDHIDDGVVCWVLKYLIHCGTTCSKILTQIPVQNLHVMYKIATSTSFPSSTSIQSSERDNLQQRVVLLIILLDKELQRNDRHDHVQGNDRQDHVFTVEQFVNQEKVQETVNSHLSEVLCQTKPETVSEALYLLTVALRLKCHRFFTSRHFDTVAELSNCLKSKKNLKQILEMLIKESNLENLRLFLSQYVSVYEEYLPVFTRKQVENYFSTTLTQISEALENLEENFIFSFEVFTQLIVAFNQIIPTDKVTSYYTTLVSHRITQRCLMSAEQSTEQSTEQGTEQSIEQRTEQRTEQSSGKTVLTKLLLILLETGKVSTESLSQKQCLLFQASYTATTSTSNKNILQILKYFEKNEVVSKYLFAHGAYVADLKHIKNIVLYKESCLKILESLDPDMMNNLINNFPLYLEEKDMGKCVISSDVEYVLSLLHHVLTVGEVQVRTILSQPISRVMLLALSSHDIITRRVAYTCVHKTLLLVEEEKFKEKSMCLYLLKMIRNSIISTEERLPHLSTYFLGKVLHALFLPHKQIYQNICFFLLQRPVFDFEDVPMFYHMFCSSALHYKHDQNWLLETLCVGLRDEMDYKIFSRRHVLPLCVSQLSCSHLDRNIAKLIRSLMLKIFSIKSLRVKKELADIGITESLTNCLGISTL